MDKIEVLIENNSTKVLIDLGTSLSELLKKINLNNQYPILGALVNNKVKELSFQIFKPKKILFFDITSYTGYQMYLRSLSFLLYKALKDIEPQANLYIKHSISGGRYCEITNISKKLDCHFITKLKARMKQLVELDLPFSRRELPTEEAIKLFEKQGMTDKVELLLSRKRIYSSVYQLDDQINYYYGYLVPSTKYLEVFNVEQYYNGILLQPPSRNNPTRCPKVVKYEKLFQIFQEHKKWVSILGVPYISELNKHVANKTISQLIQVSEALHEKKLAHIADEIHHRKHAKIILISGPSSSGKTTFAKRLAIQLKVLGHESFLISTDNYFLEREQTPRDETGNYDFERPDAIDLELLNDHLEKLLSGKEIDMPTFDFEKGTKIFGKNKLRLKENAYLIIEGIHSLNPIITSKIDDSYKYKIFVSALTQISIDSQNPIPTTDNRLIRRIVRDYRYRGYSALETLRRWPSVRRGEEKYIFPFQENADIMFNSAILCELGVLKVYAEPIISEVPENEPEYAEAVRLLKFLSYFNRIPEKEIPPTSILREFFGGSSFVY